MKIYHYRNRQDEVTKLLAPLFAMARRERVPVKETKSPVEYWVAVLDGKPIGFAGASVSGNKARLKSDFIHPNYRGNGYHQELFKARMDTLTKEGVTSFDAFCTPLSLPTLLKNGFSEEKKNEKTGIVYVKKELISEGI